MEFQKLIDEEELIIDTKRLAEWKRKFGKQELIREIDELIHKFVDENPLDWQTTTILFKLVQEIKDII